MQVLDDGTLTMVPVTIHGVPVGGARIRSDGTIELVMQAPSYLGREIKHQLETRKIVGITIGVIEP